MRILVIIVFITYQIQHAQNTEEKILKHHRFQDTSYTEIQLSRTLDLNDAKMGVWKTKDYDVYIKIQSLLDTLRFDYLSLIDLTEKYKTDSNMLSICEPSAKRYLEALNQLENAQNNFDLRSLIVYIGRYNEEQYKGNSSTISTLIKSYVQNGNAIVLYKGIRIYTLKRVIYWDYVMSIIQIYYDEPNNWVFNYFGHVNW